MIHLNCISKGPRVVYYPNIIKLFYIAQSDTLLTDIIISFMFHDDTLHDTEFLIKL